MPNKVKIGVSGTGFIARGLINALDNVNDLVLTSVLTRRDIQTVDGINVQHCLTNSIDQFVNETELIVECSGDVLHGTNVIDAALKGGLPVVTMNAELQVTTGSYFAKQGFITEAEGDQPGCLAAFKENIEAMGFDPIVYGNIKGFLNLNPSIEEMTYWSIKKGIRLPMVTSFTDGTKVQIEQTLVANGLGATILKDGLIGDHANNTTEGGQLLAEKAMSLNKPVSDYILCPGGPPGVFITAKHDDNQKEALSYYKLGEGPFYTLTTSFHLCHLEIIKTIRRVIDGKGILINNSVSPEISVASIAKRDLEPGEKITHGIGSFDVRGEACHINHFPNHIPIGLLQDAVIEKPVKAGQRLNFTDITIPKSLALNGWKESSKRLVLPT